MSAQASAPSAGRSRYVSGRSSYRPKHPKCKDCGKRHSTMLLCYPVKR
jgi:hypothetical protein